MTTTLPDGLRGRLVLPAADYRRSRLPWLRARRTGLGATDTSAVLGLNPWATPYSVWADKVTAARPVDRVVSEAAEWGSELEAVVARKVATRHPDLGKIAPTPGLLAHEEHPWMLATLDRLLVPRGQRDAAPTCPLEVKTVSEHMYRHHWLDGVPPTHILVQVQQQLAVTGYDHAFVAVLVGGQYMPEPFRVERDDAVIARMTEYAGEWWSQFVDGRTPPPLTYADRADLAVVHPGDLDLDPLVADDAVLAAFADYVDARRRRDEAIEDMDRSGFLVKRALGDHTALADEFGTILATWRPTKTGRSFRVKG